MSISFKNFSGLKYGISEKSDGDLALADNRQIFFERQGIDEKNIVRLGQIHSAGVVKVDNSHCGKIIPNADGLVTSDRNLFLTITVADCFPVYFFNPVLNSVGLAHSGWRGTVSNIVRAAVKIIGGNPADIFVGIGPGIQACHFEIKEDVLGKFAKYPEAIIYCNGKIFINLPKIIIQQLTDAGLKTANIENCGECTFCQKEKYFSFRRDRPKNVQAMVAYIALGHLNI
jgi:polyphenol oxidase